MTRKKKASESKRAGKVPKISKNDINSFFEQDADGKDEVEISTAISILSKALHFLKGSSSQKDDPFTEGCEERHRAFLSRSGWMIAKWIIPALFVIFGFLYKEVYRDLQESKREQVILYRQLQRLVEENRRILDIMGSPGGWNIEVPGPGYRTPWESRIGDHPPVDSGDQEKEDEEIHDKTKNTSSG